ncbi:MAG: AraC family transcriptional regulator [Lachnospiraceae bacterium]|nr:AraC family transcriptional regulator [Lachnospiraceae bacterium]MDE6627612.1 AraC family transcriptional regulator [Lachnospiraceae bacterium]
MEWAESISKAIEYIEENITADISVEDIAKHVNISAFYFQKGFSLLCGYTITEYIRNRRLALAAGELVAGNVKVIDVAMKYGYDSPDSFTKAFSRFHGATPSMVQKNSMMMKSFVPLKIKLSLEGGYSMDYRLTKKDSFTVMGVMKKFSYDGAKEVIPDFWKEHYEKGNGKYVCGMFGVNIDESMGQSEFEYMIADAYNPAIDIPEGFITKTIPAFTWAVFPCRGAMPDALQDVNTKIFSEWLPALKEYEFAAGYCIEMYDDVSKYPKGTGDENYYSEIWIPVKKK